MIAIKELPLLSETPMLKREVLSEVNKYFDGCVDKAIISFVGPFSTKAGALLHNV